MRELVLAAPFSDGLVLQRGKPNPIWGWDVCGQSLSLRLRGPGVDAAFETRAGAADGAFRVELPALTAPGPYTLLVEGSSVREIRDVLVGEVWLASGQSNMEWPVGQANGANQASAEAAAYQIRSLRVPRRPAREPASSAELAWESVTPNTVAGVSAVGYYFAREIARTLGVPVGIIDASYGGTRIEAWTSQEALRQCLDLDAELSRYHVPAAELEQLTREHSRRLLEWEERELPAEPGNRGVGLGYASAEFDDSAWSLLEVPGIFQAQGFEGNGVVWYRRELEIPSELAGKDLTLSLGAIDDFDHSYFNGELVGSHPKGTPGAFQIQRRYLVPGRLVRAGRNLIAVRVFDHFGEGGLLGPSTSVFAESTAAPARRFPLTGTWRAKFEWQIALVPASVFARYPSTPAALDHANAPSSLYNGMVAPLVPLALAGMLFYQGESNVEEHAHYARRFRALIRDFRTRFAQGQLPFYFVQLASFEATDSWPRLREAQAELLSEPNTGMVVSLDVGDRGDIHPRNKVEVGRRLAALALARCYGQAVPCEGPTLLSVEIHGSTCRVKFSHAEGLRSSDGAPVRGFQLGGADLGFRGASAAVQGDCVIVECPEVPSPVAVRYAFSDYLAVNLVNGAGLPALPFRTDCG